MKAHTGSSGMLPLSVKVPTSRDTEQRRSASGSQTGAAGNFSLEHKLETVGAGSMSTQRPVQRTPSVAAPNIAALINPAGTGMSSVVPPPALNRSMATSTRPAASPALAGHGLPGGVGAKEASILLSTLLSTEKQRSKAVEVYQEQTTEFLASEVASVIADLYLIQTEIDVHYFQVSRVMDQGERSRKAAIAAGMAAAAARRNTVSPKQHVTVMHETGNNPQAGSPEPNQATDSAAEAFKALLRFKAKGITELKASIRLILSTTSPEALEDNAGQGVRSILSGSVAEQGNTDGAKLNRQRAAAQAQYATANSSGSEQGRVTVKTTSFNPYQYSAKTQIHLMKCQANILNGKIKVGTNTLASMAAADGMGAVGEQLNAQMDPSAETINARTSSPLLNSAISNAQRHSVAFFGSSPITAEGFAVPITAASADGANGTNSRVRMSGFGKATNWLEESAGEASTNRKATPMNPLELTPISLIHLQKLLLQKMNELIRIAHVSASLGVVGKINLPDYLKPAVVTSGILGLLQGGGGIAGSSASAGAFLGSAIDTSLMNSAQSPSLGGFSPQHGLSGSPSGPGYRLPRGASGRFFANAHSQSPSNTNQISQSGVFEMAPATMQPMSGNQLAMYVPYPFSPISVDNAVDTAAKVLAGSSSGSPKQRSTSPKMTPTVAIDIQSVLQRCQNPSRDVMGALQRQASRGTWDNNNGTTSSTSGKIIDATVPAACSVADAVMVYHSPVPQPTLPETIFNDDEIISAAAVAGVALPQAVLDQQQKRQAAAAVAAAAAARSGGGDGALLYTGSFSNFGGQRNASVSPTTQRPGSVFAATLPDSEMGSGAYNPPSPSSPSKTLSTRPISPSLVLSTHTEYDRRTANANSNATKLIKGPQTRMRKQEDPSSPSLGDSQAGTSASHYVSEMMTTGPPSRQNNKRIPTLSVDTTLMSAGDPEDIIGSMTPSGDNEEMQAKGPNSGLDDSDDDGPFKKDRKGKQRPPSNTFMAKSTAPTGPNSPLLLLGGPSTLQQQRASAQKHRITIVNQPLRSHLSKNPAIDSLIAKGVLPPRPTSSMQGGHLLAPLPAHSLPLKPITRYEEPPSVAKTAIQKAMAVQQRLLESSSSHTGGPVSHIHDDEAYVDGDPLHDADGQVDYESDGTSGGTHYYGSSSAAQGTGRPIKGERKRSSLLDDDDVSWEVQKRKGSSGHKGIHDPRPAADGTEEDPHLLESQPQSFSINSRSTARRNQSWADRAPSGGEGERATSPSRVGGATHAPPATGKEMYAMRVKLHNAELEIQRLQGDNFRLQQKIEVFQAVKDHLGSANELGKFVELGSSVAAAMLLQGLKRTGESLRPPHLASVNMAPSQPTAVALLTSHPTEAEGVSHPTEASGVNRSRSPSVHHSGVSKRNASFVHSSSKLTVAPQHGPPTLALPSLPQQQPLQQHQHAPQQMVSKFFTAMVADLTRVCGGERMVFGLPSTSSGQLQQPAATSLSNSARSHSDNPDGASAPLSPHLLESVGGQQQPLTEANPSNRAATLFGPIFTGAQQQPQQVPAQSPQSSGGGVGPLARRKSNLGLATGGSSALPNTSAPLTLSTAIKNPPSYYLHQQQQQPPMQYLYSTQLLFEALNKQFGLESPQQPSSMAPSSLPSLLSSPTPQQQQANQSYVDSVSKVLNYSGGAFAGLLATMPVGWVSAALMTNASAQAKTFKKSEAQGGYQQQSIGGNTLVTFNNNTTIDGQSPADPGLVSVSAGVRTPTAIGLPSASPTNGTSVPPLFLPLTTLTTSAEERFVQLEKIVAFGAHSYQQASMPIVNSGAASGSGGGAASMQPIPLSGPLGTSRVQPGSSIATASRASQFEPTAASGGGALGIAGLSSLATAGPTTGAAFSRTASNANGGSILGGGPPSPQPQATNKTGVINADAILAAINAALAANAAAKGKKSSAKQRRASVAGGASSLSQPPLSGKGGSGYNALSLEEPRGLESEEQIVKRLIIEAAANQPHPLDCLSPRSVRLAKEVKEVLLMLGGESSKSATNNNNNSVAAAAASGYGIEVGSPTSAKPLGAGLAQSGRIQPPQPQQQQQQPASRSGLISPFAQPLPTGAVTPSTFGGLLQPTVVGSGAAGGPSALVIKQATKTFVGLTQAQQDAKVLEWVTAYNSNPHLRNVVKIQNALIELLLTSLLKEKTEMPEMTA